MMKARVVIGANYGDEGKGLVTDYLCSQGAGMVVRFNGGAQAGHTVVTPEGERHVFHHFGSGTFLGVPTFLSQFFVCNPILFVGEETELMSMWEGAELPPVYAHPDCVITTFADMIINQYKHIKNKHGSCGVGINETVNRSQIDNLKITVGDLWNGRDLALVLHEICNKYSIFRTGKPLSELMKGLPSIDGMIEHFIIGCKVFAEAVHPLGIQQCQDPVFEGAQGLLLDQNRKQDMPHLTRSNTGMQNVRKLCAMAGIDEIETYYVSRTYLTRHGNGPLPGENSKMRYDDDTNVDHPFQGKLRFAPLDSFEMMKRISKDYGGKGCKLVLTHCDQLVPEGIGADLYSYGSTRNDIQTAPGQLIPLRKKIS
jgi:adenylosuccinate synthase